MSIEVENMIKKIEEKRIEMIQLGLARSFVDEGVLQLSSQLDKLLNEYEFLLKNKRAAISDRTCRQHV
ncbi:aspartyl-phosphate phosphatase Spo0E family protein [Siminovitchia sp. FSL W7-1587]|uniref:aspartyl-phosphate phosphatase Spo0E family protein n=1 Tax=Siminovitchia sp. FSL W7-1587 TaxID=2954699 RepID=UPI0030D3EED0